MASAITDPKNRRVQTHDCYVGNLPADADQKRVGKIFSQFGEIHSIWVNSSDGGNKFAFVKFYCEEDCNKAIQETNGTLFEGGKPINVRRATKSKQFGVSNRGGKRENDQDGIQEKDDGKLPVTAKTNYPDVVSSFDGGIQIQESQPPPPPRKDLEVFTPFQQKVFATHVETPVVVWGQKMNEESANEVASLVEQLAVVCPEAPRVSGKPETDKMYGAQFSEDQQWYRCVVRYFYGTDRVKVQYVDFGNTEEVNPNSLVELPKSLMTQPPCAIKYMLHSLYCNNNQDQTAIKFLKDLVDQKEMEVCTTARLSDHTGFYSEVFVNGVNIGDKMTENNFCFKKPGLKGRALGDAGGMNRSLAGAVSENTSHIGGLLPFPAALMQGEPQDNSQHQEKLTQGLQQSQASQVKPAPQSQAAAGLGQTESGKKIMAAPHNPPHRNRWLEQQNTQKQNCSIKGRVSPAPGGGGGGKKFLNNNSVSGGAQHANGPKKSSSAAAVQNLSQSMSKMQMTNGGKTQGHYNKGMHNGVSENSQHGMSAGGFKSGYGMREGSRKFDNEKDELSNLRWKLKNLQTEYTSLSNKAQENDMTKQIKTLQVLSTSVRKLRNQFPLDKSTPLDEAIGLVQGPGKISLDLAQSLHEVVNSVQAYRNAQEEILKCSDSSVLKEKIEARDEMRRELYEKLGSSVEEINSLPLQDRGKKVQEVVVALTKHYDNYTKVSMSSSPSTLDTLLPVYEEWKAKKKVDVIGARRQSDVTESTITSLLSQLTLQISLNPENEGKELSEDLATTFKTYAEVLQQEIAVWDADNLSDTALIASLVQLLLQDLRQESQCVEQLTKMLSEFTSMRDGICPWLTDTPNLDKLQAIRKKLKSLKSKLRHKLADKADAEENQDAEELEEIKTDLESIRGDIHKALTEEDNLMGELSTLAKDHFPELLNSEQDTGFGAHLTYKGLVKTSHAPDHYTLTPVGSSTSGMYLSLFDGEPVIIKEYFLKDGNHLDKEEFLSQMGLFTNASSPNLEPVHSVFFDKNNRHAYVQVKKQGELLSTLIEQTVLTKEQVQSIVKSLCAALQALHTYNFVHGQIQPEYVVVDDENNARLLPPDFSLTDTDRCRSKYQTESNMEMTAPEMKQSMIMVEPCHAIDVYCLGLLALWMHFPKVAFLENKNGVVDISGVQMDRNLGIFITKLLCPNPLLRPTAENCLRSEYLNQPVIESAASPAATMLYGKPESSSSTPTIDACRNTASPASSTDGLVYSDPNLGGGLQISQSTQQLQMIANTRVPPPPIMAVDNLMNSAVLPANTSQQRMSSPGPSLSPQQQHIQQQLIQQQLLQQQQSQLIQQQQSQLQQQQQSQLQQQSQQLQQQSQQLQQQQSQQLQQQQSQQLQQQQSQQLQSQLIQQQQSQQLQQQQSQQLQQQYHYHQQQQYQQQLEQSVTLSQQVTPISGTQDQRDFEIGTFDPTAFEVVTSPQPPTPTSVNGDNPQDMKQTEEHTPELSGSGDAPLTIASNDGSRTSSVADAFESADSEA